MLNEIKQGEVFDFENLQELQIFSTVLGNPPKGTFTVDVTNEKSNNLKITKN